MDPLQRPGQTTQQYDQHDQINDPFEKSGRFFGKTVKKHPIILRLLKGWHKFRHSKLISHFFPAKTAYPQTPTSKAQRKEYVPSVVGMSPEEVKGIYARNNESLPTKPVTTPQGSEDDKKRLLTSMAQHAQVYEEVDKLEDILRVLNHAAKLDTSGGHLARKLLNDYHMLRKG